MIFSWPLSTPRLTDHEMILLPWHEVATLPNIIEDLYASCTDSVMRKFTQVPEHYTRQMAEDFIQDTGSVRWALTVENRYCGNIELRLTSAKNLTVNVGYNTAPHARCKGLMTRAVRLIAHHAFSCGVYRLELLAAVQNTGSLKVAENAGFIFEGVARGAEQVRGSVHDIAVYAKLAGDE